MQSLLLCMAACVASSYGYTLETSQFYQNDYGTPLGSRFGGYCSVNWDDGDHVNLNGIVADLQGHSTFDIQYLYVYAYGPTGTESIERLPQNLHTLMYDLVYLSWSSRLKYVQASDFAFWPNLIELHLYNNMLRQLPGDLLSNNPHIQTLDFSMNAISEIGSGFFDNLGELTQITFWSNPCMSTYMQTTDIHQAKADLMFYCGALPTPVSNVCPAACSSRINSIAAQVNAASAAVDTISNFIASLPKK